MVLQAAEGPLAMCQAYGAIVAFHANLRAVEGANGEASHKVILSAPDVRHWLELLGRELSWHGALSADAILAVDGPLLVDHQPAAGGAGERLPLPCRPGRPHAHASAGGPPRVPIRRSTGCRHPPAPPGVAPPPKPSPSRATAWLTPTPPGAPRRSVARGRPGDAELSGTGPSDPIRCRSGPLQKRYKSGRD
jgi:hypothetical protein